MMDLNQALTLPGDGTICTCAAIFKDRKLLVGLRHYGTKWEGELQASSLWVTPGGRSDAGETVETCLRREVQEETGITDLNIIGFLGEIPGARSPDRLFIFLCTSEEDPLVMESDKFEEWRWCVLEEVPDPFINPLALALIREKGRS